MKNNKGSNTDPCATPHLMVNHGDGLFFLSLYSLLFCTEIRFEPFYYRINFLLLRIRKSIEFLDEFYMRYSIKWLPQVYVTSNVISYFKNRGLSAISFPIYWLNGIKKVFSSRKSITCNSKKTKKDLQQFFWVPWTLNFGVISDENTLALQQIWFLVSKM